ncbi:MAG: HNH endonuclease [Bacteroidales bacterium]|jgi:5-methylcytosine-specific restriction endonuclease McrA|nr:HNH endonuclease [Bacteroidales bacterium]
MNFQIVLILICVIAIILFRSWLFEQKRKKRRDYYRNEYLKSDAWQRKRYVVLKRDNWRCVYCGGRATQVHHKKYAKRNIGKEPIEWLVSVCNSCHNAQHS